LDIDLDYNRSRNWRMILRKFFQSLIPTRLPWKVYFLFWHHR